MRRVELMHLRLERWGMWRLMQGSGKLGFAGVRLGAAALEARDPWGAQAVVPISDVEGSETDAAVRALADELRQTVEAAYLGRGTVGDRAARLGISRAAWKERLCRADLALQAWLAERERQAAERRQVLLRGVLPALPAVRGLTR